MATFTIDLLSGKEFLFTGNFNGSGGTSTISPALQLIDSTGNAEINAIPVTPINWTTIEFSGASLSFTGGSKIHVLSSGVYAVGYVLNFASLSGGTKNIGAIIRKNGNTYITPSTSNAFAIGSPSDIGTNIMPPYETSLLSGDYIELLAYRVGGVGSVLTMPSASWIAISKQR
jgi:hypothetical protein